MIDIKCTNCGKKIGEAKIQQGELRIKCKCGTTNNVKSEPATVSTKCGTYTQRLDGKLEKK